MTFKRPTNITLTQMTQWVDTNMYTPECDENILCEYIYHIVYSYAQKHLAFQEYEQFDDFALYCCARLFVRLRRNDDASKIRSIYSYIKNIAELWKADYIRETCVGSPEVEVADFDLFDFGDYLMDASSEYDYYTYAMCGVNPSDVVHKYLSRIPKKINSPEWMNIYISCLLTLNDRITTVKTLSKDLIDSKDTILYNKLMRAAKVRKPILYHLDESMSNYILTLVNELMHAISAELSVAVASKVSVSTCLRNLVTAANEAEDD